MRFILGTAGHIDHGKSSLIKALTGVDPDRLPEEQKRGVTIELGFAHLEIADHQIGVVDVPGHADFVNNMVSGVGALDLAVFVVAADDGWMPQSEEHLHILSYLGVKNILIALTKVDMCEDVDFMQEMIREEVAGTMLAEVPIIPVSSHSGEGLDELKEAIEEAAKNIKHDIKGRQPRLHVDRVFSPTGVGTVVTGTLGGSELTVGDPLMCYPIMQKTTLRHIQMHNNKSETSSPGSRVGLNLSDIAVDTRGKPGARRGCLLAPEGLLLSDTLDVHLERLNREINGQTATKRPIKNTETVIVHVGTARVKARVVLIDTTTLSPGESSFAQLRLEEPLAICLGDHFVLRDGAQQGTLAGGMVLDAFAEARKFRSEERKAFLTSRLEAMDTPRNLLLHEIEAKNFRASDNPLINTSYSKSAIAQAAQKLTSEKKIIEKGGFYISKKWWGEALTSAGQIILDYHKSHPDETVMPIEDWRRSLKPFGITVVLSPAVEEALISGDFSKKELGLSHQDHNLELPERLQSIADKLISDLKTAGMQPPILVEMLDTEDKQSCMTFLIKSKQVTELSPKAVMLTEQVDKAITKVVNFIKANGPATSSDIRQEIGATRKVLIPLLELMDARNITERDGDFRKLR